MLSQEGGPGGWGPMASKEGGGGGEGSWQTQGSRGNGHKRAASREESGTEDIPEKHRRTKSPEELSVLLKVKGSKPGEPGFKAINPLHIDASLRSQLTAGYEAKVLFNGVLKVTCVNTKQFDVARKLTKIVNKVERVDMGPREGGGSKGVVYGLWAGLSDQEIMDNIKGAEVVEVKRFRSREGARSDPPVLLTFRDLQLPSRVLLGSMAYRVAEYIRPPLRCYKCQRYGHIADACRGVQRCAKCGGDHGIKECTAEAPKCPNCGGDHTAAYRECEHTVRARKVQEVKDRDKITYAEAAKRVSKEGGVEGRGGAMLGGGLHGNEPGTSRGPSVPPGMLVMSKEAFLGFIVEVLAEAKKLFAKDECNESDALGCIVRRVAGAAGRFLGVKQGPEELHSYFSKNKGGGQHHSTVIEREEHSAGDGVGS